MSITRLELIMKYLLTFLLSFSAFATPALDIGVIIKVTSGEYQGCVVALIDRITPYHYLAENIECGRIVVRKDEFEVVNQ